MVTLEEPDWKGVVSVVPATALRAELMLRIENQPQARSVWVTDLIDLRKAYWSAVSPVPPNEERRARIEAGRELHAAIGRRLATPNQREVRVRRGGIVGQIDLLEDRPIEVKTSSSFPDAGSLGRGRSSYVEQLAMYCALLGHVEGRLLLVRVDHDSTVDLRVYDFRFDNLEAIFHAMQSRADLLRRALADRSPEALPRCHWRGRGCEYEETPVCSCTGDEQEDDFLEGAVGLDAAENSAERDRLYPSLVPISARGEKEMVTRFRDLLYPRRAFFERTSPREESFPSRPLHSTEEDLYSTLSSSLEGGPAGEMTRVAPPGDEPIESVPCLRGDPVLVRISHGGFVPSESELLREHPQYFLELGLRCVATGRSRGWLVMGYRRSKEWEDRLRVYEVRFPSLTVFSRIWRSRARALRDALGRNDPTQLVRCPPWMFDGCPYRESCGCREASLASDGLVQR